MTTRRVQITIDSGFKHPGLRVWLRKIASTALDVTLPDQTCQMSLVVCDDETIRRLNREYRGLDETTDVLAFSSEHPGPWQGTDIPSKEATMDVLPFILPPEEPPYLGEVLVSYPQVNRQSVESGNEAESEWALLVTHGILHLLGYDHQKTQQTRAMEGKQNEILTQLFDG